VAIVLQGNRVEFMRRTDCAKRVYMFIVKKEMSTAFFDELSV
jgi:hypothetical protein